MPRLRRPCQPAITVLTMRRASTSRSGTSEARRRARASASRVATGAVASPIRAIRAIHAFCASVSPRLTSRPMTSRTFMPSARAAKVSAMRCCSTGSASAQTSSTDGASRPSKARGHGRTASAPGWRAAPAPRRHACRYRRCPGPGRAERTSSRIASTTLSGTGMRRISVLDLLQPRRQRARSAALASSTPVVSSRMRRSASISG